MGARGCNRYDTRLGGTRLIRFPHIPPPSGEHQNLVHEHKLPTEFCSTLWWKNWGGRPRGETIRGGCGSGYRTSSIVSLAAPTMTIQSILRHMGEGGT